MTKALYAEFTVVAGNEDRVRDLVDELARHVRAEPGNIIFEPHVLEEDPLHYFVYEVYADDAAFQLHLEQEHGRVFNEKLRHLVAGGASQLTMLR